MVLKNSKTGWVFPSPSSFKLTINDIDLDSYRSPVTADLIDKSLALGMVGLSVGWDYLTEEKSEEVMNQTWVNPMYLTIKAPILGGRLLTAEFRCAKRDCEMIRTEEAEDTFNTQWIVSFTASQKKKVDGQ